MFTVPREVAAIALQNKCVTLSILFRAATRALREIAADPAHLGAQIGGLAVMHTWGQCLQFHPHVHCVVPGGGLAPQHDRWIASRPRFFLPVKVLSRRFRTLFLRQLHSAFRRGKLRFGGSLAALSDPAAFDRHLRPLRQAEWVVYSKPPFAGPAKVLAYLGRYTHRVAIANHRLLAIGNGLVRFRWRDYRRGGRRREMTLRAPEFIRNSESRIIPSRSKKAGGARAERGIKLGIITGC